MAINKIKRNEETRQATSKEEKSKIETGEEYTTITTQMRRS